MPRAKGGFDPMFQRILIPVDFTQKNQDAIRAAIRIASLDQAEMTLLHVIQTLEIEDDTIRAYYDSLESKAWERMEDLARSFADQCPSLQQRVMFGDRAAEIVRYAIEHEMGLIVLSSHRVDWESHPNRWATLSYQVSVLCPCPAMLVK